MLGEKAKRLQARGSLLGSSDTSEAAIVACDWKCTLMLCQHRGTNSDSPLLDVKQGRFQGADVTNNLFVRGSYLHLS
jgi:hypothetical protein